MLLLWFCDQSNSAFVNPSFSYLLAFLFYLVFLLILKKIIYTLDITAASMDPNNNKDVKHIPLGLGKDVVRQIHLNKVHVAKTAVIQPSEVSLTQMRSYSYNSYPSGSKTEVGEENKGIRVLFKDNKLLVWLPSIIFDGNRDNSVNKTSDNDFDYELKALLGKLSLDNSFFYELKYSMFLHSNDKNKDLVYYLAPDSGFESAKNDLSHEEFYKWMVGAKLLYERFKYHGYYSFRTDRIDFIHFQDYISYISSVHTYLLNCIPSINKKRDEEFIEFRKSTLLTITRIPRDQDGTVGWRTFSNEATSSLFKNHFPTLSTVAGITGLFIGCWFNLELILVSFITPILSFVLFLNWILFYMDDFKLSSNRFIRTLQILTPIWLLVLVLILFYLEIWTFTDGALFLDGDKNTNNTVNIGGSIEMSRSAAEVIGRNIGIAGTVAGVSGAVGKAIAKSSMPPLQKAGIIIGAGLAGGAIHVGTTAVNRAVNAPSNTPSTNFPPSDISNINKLIPDPDGSGYSDLMLLLLSIDTLTSVCLSLVLILFMMILFKFYLKEDKIKFNFSSIVGEKSNQNLNHYLIKLIQLNKKTSSLYIFIILILLFIALGYDCYFITQLYNNLDKFVDLHINSRK